MGEDRGREKEKVRVEEGEKEEGTEGGQRWREDCDEEGGEGLSRPAKKHCGGGGRKRWGEGKSEVEGRLEVRRKTRREVEKKRQEDWPKERWRGGGKHDRKEGGKEGKTVEGGVGEKGWKGVPDGRGVEASSEDKL